MAIQINGPDPAASDQVIDWLVQPLMSHRTSLKNPLHWEEASGGLQIACENWKKKEKVHEKERANNQDGGICICQSGKLLATSLNIHAVWTIRLWILQPQIELTGK